jgi:hypothetical protein
MADTNDLTSSAPAPAPATPELKTEPTPTADPKLEAFARKERQLRKEQQRLQAERAEWENKIKTYETDYIPRSSLKTDTLQALEAAGISYDQLTEMVLAQPNQNDPATRAMLAKIKSLEEKQIAQERMVADQAQQQYDQAVKQINTEVKLLVDSDVEYATIKSTGMHDAVTELIKTTFDTEGYLMDITEAAKQVEDYLVDEGFKLAQSEKIQSRLKPAAAPAAPAPAQPKQSQTSVQLKTLTNNIPSQPAKRSSDKERRERAMRAFRGENI